MVGACIVGLILRSPKIRRSATLIEANETRAVTWSFFDRLHGDVGVLLLAAGSRLDGERLVRCRDLAALDDSVLPEPRPRDDLRPRLLEDSLPLPRPRRLHVLCGDVRAVLLGLEPRDRRRVARQELLRLGQPVQPFSSVGVLELHGRHLQLRAVETPVPVHRRRRERRRRGCAARRGRHRERRRQRQPDARRGGDPADRDPDDLLPAAAQDRRSAQRRRACESRGRDDGRQVVAGFPRFRDEPVLADDRRVHSALHGHPGLHLLRDDRVVAHLSRSASSAPRSWRCAMPSRTY